MDDSTEGLLLVAAASTVSLIRVLEEKGLLQREDSMRLFDQAGLWLSELTPKLMSPGARDYAATVLEGMAQTLFDKKTAAKAPRPKKKGGEAA